MSFNERLNLFFGIGKVNGLNFINLMLERVNAPFGAEKFFFLRGVFFFSFSRKFTCFLSLLLFFCFVAGR